jgi:hypothetical protein
MVLSEPSFAAIFGAPGASAALFGIVYAVAPTTRIAAEIDDVVISGH